jgi:hypothetical protein
VTVPDPWQNAAPLELDRPVLNKPDPTSRPTTPLLPGTCPKCGWQNGVDDPTCAACGVVVAKFRARQEAPRARRERVTNDQAALSRDDGNSPILGLNGLPVVEHNGRSRVPVIDNGRTAPQRLRRSGTIDVGGILSDAVRATVARAGAITLMSVVPSIVVVVAAFFMVPILSLGVLATIGRSATAPLAMFFAATVVLGWIMAVGVAAIYRLVFEQLEDPDGAASLRTGAFEALRDAIPAGGRTMLIFGALGLVTIAPGCLGGVVAGLAGGRGTLIGSATTLLLLPVALWLTLRLSIAAPIGLIDGATTWEAFQRSFARTRGWLGSLLVTYILAGLIMLCFFGVAAMFGKVPYVGWVVVGVVSLIGSAVFSATIIGVHRALPE